jgi:peptide/nickel transport system substrate-binding protein
MKNPPSFPGRLLAMILGALSVLGGSRVAPRLGLGQEAAEPGGDLLRSVPFDRITLNDGTVLVVEPISPRPLPPYDPAKDKQSGKARSKKFTPPQEGNIGLPGEKSKFKGVEEKDEGDASQLNEVTIHLFKGEARDFVVKRSNVRKVEYFEDLLLAEADRLTLARQYARAFECLLRVQARDPAWPGLDDHANRLLYAEGSAGLLEGDSEKGLRLLRELSARKPDYPGPAFFAASRVSSFARAT